MALDASTGKVIWEKAELAVDHYRGPASSPVVWGDSLFLTFDGFDKQFFACLDKKTGDVKWKKERAIKWKTDNGDLKKAFSTPQVIEVDGKPQVISSAAEATIAYNPKTGDEIEIDVDKRLIHLHVSDAELARRKAAWTPPPPKYPRGYGALFSEHIGQADQGCDFDFLAAGGAIPEPEIH